MHRASGAVGESQQERSQLQNKRAAFKRMAQTPKFQAWIKRQLSTDVLAQTEVNRLEMAIGRGNLQTEVYRSGGWYIQ